MFLDIADLFSGMGTDTRCLMRSNTIYHVTLSLFVNLKRVFLEYFKFVFPSSSVFLIQSVSHFEVVFFNSLVVPFHH